MRKHRYPVSTLLHQTNKNSRVLLCLGPVSLTNARRLATFVSKAIDNVAEKITVREAMEHLGLKT
jgi:hypothetical protein